MTGTIAKEFDWDLDATGNWESLTQKTSGSTDFTQNRDHNEVNEVTSADDAGGSSSGPGNWVDPAYDNNGNMTTMPRPTSLANSYIGVYDAWNRLIEVKIGSTVKQANEYDGLHRRIVRDESNGSGDVRHFYYSQQWQVLEERVGSSSNAFAQYVYGPRYVDEIIFRERDTNDNGVIDQKHYYLQDANFNVTALVNTSGDAQERYLYDPYGEVTIMDGSWGSRSSSLYDNEMLFTGRRVDPETGLQLNRHRFHHQQLGRWVSRDPLQYGGGTWNLFEYVDSSPTTGRDTYGLENVTKPGTSPPNVGGVPVSPISQQTVNQCREHCRDEIGWFIDSDDIERLKFCDCMQWIHDQQQIDHTWLNQLPNCPCSLSSVNSAIWTKPKPPECCHPGASKCIRTRKQSKGGHGQQCCYDSSGKLITNGVAAGTPDYSHSWPPNPSHFRDDVKPWADCMDSGIGQFYYAYRPPNNGNNCPKNEVNPGGTPMPRP